MKNLLLTILLFASTYGHAKPIGTETVVELRACSSYIVADPREHASSAVANFKSQSLKLCLEKGYDEWKLLNQRITPGLVNAPVYCIDGQVVCY